MSRGGVPWLRHEAAGSGRSVIHEAESVGLEARCGGLEEPHARPVERMYVSGVSDLDATAAEIAARLTDQTAEPVSVVLTLNAVVSLAAVEDRT